MPDVAAVDIPSSPIALLGSVVLWGCLILASYAAAAGIIGNTRHRRALVTSSVQALYGFAALAVLASALLIYAFVTHDYTIKYVAATSDATMPLWYKITAYWGALEGSLMFWVAVLAVFAAIAVRANAEKHRDMIGYVVAVIMLTQVFFLAVLVYNKNPFATFLTDPPVDGKGLNPLLQTYWMVIHPPSLYVGFVAATIPFAFGIAALASGRLDDRWLESVRSWSLICFFFLSLGLILGGRWAYEELGWGGYWAWDPVENAGLIPWFTMTAFLHSIMIQEQRGMMKVWNLLLVILTFWLTIFGTFMTRSGVVQSVHAFGEDNELALLFILFMAAIFVVSFGLLIYRLPRLRSSNAFESFISREYAFLLNNWVLLGCAVFVLFATMFPTLSEGVNGERITVAPEFFNKWMTPLGLVLLLLAGAAPLLAWRRTTRQRLWSQFSFPLTTMVVAVVALGLFLPRTRTLTSILSDSLRLPVSLLNFGIVAFTVSSIGQEFWRGTRVRMKQTGGGALTALVGLLVTKQRKYGGYVIHVGIAVMFIGFAGQAYEAMEDRTVTADSPTFLVRDHEWTVAPGESVPTDELRNFSFDYRRFDIEQRHGYTEYRATVGLKDADGNELGVLTPSKRDYDKSDQPTTEVDLISTIEQDIYIILTNFEKQGSKVAVVNFRVYIQPLINWVWIGFGILMLGTAICLLPKRWIDRSRRGPAAMALLVLVSSLLVPAYAMAQPASGGEYEQGSGHQVGAGDAHLYREDDPQFLAPYRGKAAAEIRRQHPDWPESGADFERAVAAGLRPIADFNQHLMENLFCMCGGCSRETLYACRCGFATQDRKRLLGMLAGYDLSTSAGRERAESEVFESFIQRYGKAVVPSKSKAQWAVPYIAVIVSLLLLIIFGRKWVARGNRAEEENLADDGDVEDSEYAELLDDELRDTDE